MEPKLPAPNQGPEQLPSVFNQGGEFTPTLPSLERPSEQRHEAVESRSAQELAAAGQPVVLPTVVQPPEPVVDDTTGSAPDGKAVPLVAADDDLIEKEWVDKAKAIIAETKDNPYQREEEVGKLQADYLRKRYGKELGAS